MPHVRVHPVPQKLKAGQQAFWGQLLSEDLRKYFTIRAFLPFCLLLPLLSFKIPPAVRPSAGSSHIWGEQWWDVQGLQEDDMAACCPHADSRILRPLERCLLKWAAAWPVYWNSHGNMIVIATYLYRLAESNLWTISSWCSISSFQQVDDADAISIDFTSRSTKTQGQQGEQRLPLPSLTLLAQINNHAETVPSGVLNTHDVTHRQARTP